MAHGSPGITRMKRPWFASFAGVRLAAMALLLVCIVSIPRVGPARALGSGSDAAPILSLEEIAPGVYVSQGRYDIASPDNRGQISNIGFIVGGEAVAIIDTGGSAAVGHALKAAVRRITPLPIRYVINTHMHPDHVLGNAAFSDSGENVVFAGHRKLARALRARGAHYLQSNTELIGELAFSGTRIIFPAREVADSLTLDLGGRELRLTAHPTAHTDNDLTVFDVQTRTLWLGDLLFSRHIPVIDGSISGWLEVIKKLKTENAARVVPGHGPPSMPWPEAANAQMRYLSGLRDTVRRYIDEGRTMGEAQRDIQADRSENWLLSEEYQARNVSAAFTSLEWE